MERYLAKVTLLKLLSDKGWYVKRQNKLFKEVARFRFNEKTNGEQPTSQRAFRCVASFYNVQYEVTNL